MNKEVILGVIRHLLTASGGFVVAKGLVDDAATWEPIVGAIVTVVGFVWSAFAPEKKTPAG